MSGEHVGPTHDLREYVTRTELVGHLAPLAEIRTMLRDDIRELHAGQQGLSAQIAKMDERITSRQDVANHRTDQNERAVIAAALQLADVSKQVATVQDTVTTIETDGCDKQHEHVRMLHAMAQAGMMPDTGELQLEGGTRTLWQKHGTKGAWAGAGAGLALLLPHVFQFLHWVLEHLQSQVSLP